MSSKIVSLQIENFKKVVAVEIVPGPESCVLIGGRNASGKTSCLDAIMAAMAGKSALPDKPLRNGTTSGIIRIELDNLVVERKFNESGSTLKVMSKEGATFTSPQRILDDLYCKLSFDPLAFLTMKPADQSAQLMSLVGIDTSELDAEYKETFEERTAMNRLVKEAESDVARIPTISDENDVPAEKPNVEAIVARLKNAMAIRDSETADREVGARLIREIDDLKERSQRLQAEYESAFDKWATAEKEQVDRNKRLDDAMTERHERELKELQRRHLAEVADREQAAKDDFVAIQAMKRQDNLDTTAAINKCAELIGQKNETLKEWRETPRQTYEEIEPLQTALENANRDALLWDKVAEKKLRQSVLTKRKAQSDAMTADLEAILKRKRDMLAKAKYPINGLAVDSECVVMFDGVPFSQASRAQQIRTSVAIGLAMNPKLPVLLIRDGSLLDDEHLAIVREMADTSHAQIWIERVGNKDECAIIIEDGHVAGVEPVVADAKPARKTRKRATSTAEAETADQNLFT